MYNSACQRCPLYESTTNPCIPGTGSLDAKIVLYGEAPGATEEQGGEPFIGDSGKLLNDALAKVGLNREDLYITNVVRCRPPDNRTPNARELRECRIYTAEELATIQPAAIVTLGGTPLKSLTGLTAIGRARGSVQRLTADYRSDAPVIPTYHPAAALHNPGNREMILDALVSDLRSAKALAYGLEAQTSGPKVEVVAPTLEVFKKLSRCKELAIDGEWETENVLLKAEKLVGPWMKRRDGTQPKLVSLGMAGELEDGTILATSVPWALEQYDAQRKAFAVVASHVPNIYHFATADLPWVLDAGIDPKVAGDTFVLAGLLNIEGSASLEALTAEYTDFPQWKNIGDEVKGRMPSDLGEWRKLLRYNALDCAATLVLHKRMIEMAAEQGRERVLTLYRSVLCPSLKTFSKASLKGVLLDAERLAEGGAAVEKRIAEVESAIAEMVGMPDRREVTRGDALAPLVERLMNIQLPRTEKTNKPSLKVDHLLKLKGDHPIVDLLLELSWLRKKRSAYFSPWNSTMKRYGDGRLRAFFKLTTARTGRTSMEGEEGSTLQQFPRQEDPEAFPGVPESVTQMRHLVTAPEGWVLALADESQVELRIGAAVANERHMIEWYREGWRKEGNRWFRTGEAMRDLHTMTGGWLKASKEGALLSEYLADTERWTSTITKPERTGAKIPNFGFLYGGYETVVIDAALKDYGIKLTWSEAHDMRQGYFTLYPDLAHWHQTNGPRDLNIGYCESMLGRRRYLSSMPGEDENGMMRKLLNTPVQSLASDLTLAAMVRVDLAIEERGLQNDAFVTGFVHDSVMVECREEVLPEIKEIMRDAMEDPMLEELGLDLPVPLMADVEVGPSWGLAK